METIKIQALVLRSLDYKDNDKLVTLASIQNGKLTALLKGCRTSKAKLRFAGGSFCFGEYLLSGKPESYTITGCSQIDLFAPLYDDVEKLYAGLIVGEFLDKITADGEEISMLIVLALKALKMLAYGKEDVACILLWYTLAVLKAVGYKPTFAVCSRCGEQNVAMAGFSHELGGTVCRNCIDQSTALLSPSEANVLRILADTTPDNLSVMHFERSILTNCLKLIKGYFGFLTSKTLNAMTQYLSLF